MKSGKVSMGAFFRVGWNYYCKKGVKTIKQETFNSINIRNDREYLK